MCLGLVLTHKAKGGQRQRQRIQQHNQSGQERQITHKIPENILKIWQWEPGDFLTVPLLTQAYLPKTPSNTCFAIVTLQNNSFCCFLFNLPSCFLSLGTHPQPSCLTHSQLSLWPTLYSHLYFSKLQISVYSQNSLDLHGISSSM